MAAGSSPAAVRRCDPDGCRPSVRSFHWRHRADVS